MKVLKSRWTWGAVALAGAVIFATGCAMGVGKGGAYVGVGPTAESLQRHGAQIQAEGEESGNPLQQVVGAGIALVGLLGSIFAGKKAGATVYAREEAKPYTPAEVAEIKAAVNGTATTSTAPPA